MTYNIYIKNINVYYRSYNNIQVIFKNKCWKKKYVKDIMRARGCKPNDFTRTVLVM